MSNNRQAIEAYVRFDDFNARYEMYMKRQVEKDRVSTSNNQQANAESQSNSTTRTNSQDRNHKDSGRSTNSDDWEIV